MRRDPCPGATSQSGVLGGSSRSPGRHVGRRPCGGRSCPRPAGSRCTTDASSRGDSGAPDQHPVLGAQPPALPRPDRGRGRPILGRRSAPRRTRGQPTAVVLCRRAHARGLARQGSAVLRPHGTCCGRRSLTPDDASSRPRCGDVRVFNASSRKATSASTACSRRRGRTSACNGRRATDLVEQDDGYALLDVRPLGSLAERLPLAYAHARPDRGAHHRADHSTRDRAGDRHPEGLPARFLLSTTLRSTATTAPRPYGPLQARRHRDRPAADPDTDVGRRFPTVSFAGSAGWPHHRSGEPRRVLFADRRSRRSRL